MFVGRPRLRTIQAAAEDCEDPDAANLTCFANDLGRSTTRPPVNAAAISGLQWRQVGSVGAGHGSQSPYLNSTGGAVPVIEGKLLYYPDGGLAFVLPAEHTTIQIVNDEGNNETVDANVEALKSSGAFINLNTRAFVAELSFYNADARVFTAAHFLVEMTREGLYVPSIRFLNFRRTSFIAPGDYGRLALAVVTLLLMGYYLYHEVVQMRERWVAPMEDGSEHWKAKGNDKDNEARQKELTEARNKLLKRIKEEGGRPVLGKLMISEMWLEAQDPRLKGVLTRCRNKLSLVVRPYFYKVFK